MCGHRCLLEWQSGGSIIIIALLKASYHTHPANWGRLLGVSPLQTK